MQSDTRQALKEGFADAAGFVLGALAGWGLGQLLGLDFFANPGFGWRETVGLVLIALGCGLGKTLARRLILKPATQD